MYSRSRRETTVLGFLGELGKKVTIDYVEVQMAWVMIMTVHSPTSSLLGEHVNERLFYRNHSRSLYHCGFVWDWRRGGLLNDERTGTSVDEGVLTSERSWQAWRPSPTVQPWRACTAPRHGYGRFPEWRFGVVVTRWSWSGASVDLLGYAQSV